MLKIKKLLISGGGHSMAAGLKIKKEKLMNLNQFLNNI